MRNRQSIEMKQLVGKTGRLLDFFFFLDTMASSSRLVCKSIAKVKGEGIESQEHQVFIAGQSLRLVPL